ncbi:RNA polymerase sigma factor [Candidatus Saccharibacteria bacterium]|nr:MAG: RNA polymerase sigma factor [Candidatus Saccharibacteria bacterium]
MQSRKGKLSTWLFKIATNKALNWLKREARSIAATDELIAGIASTQPGPAESALQCELHNAVEHLQPKYRAVISLYYWQGFNYREIADVLGAPLGSVKVWMQRAKHNLRKELT